MVDTERILSDLIQTVILDEGLKNAEVNIKDVSSDGANYSSTLHFITVKCPGKDNLELFAKVAAAGKKMRDEMEADEFFVTERVIYQELKKSYEKLQRKNNIPKHEWFSFPKFYASSDAYLEETIILENLTIKGYTTYDRFKSIDWAYASAAIGELAKFHALSFTLAEDDPEEFRRMAGDRRFWYKGSEDQAKFFEGNAKTALEIVPQEHKGRLEKFLNKYLDSAEFIKLFSTHRCPVLVHGDYRASNLLHTEKNGQVHLIPVDYQTFYNGCPIADLLYFIFCGSDGDFRRKHYQQLVDHYYATLSDYLNKLGLSAKKIYPRNHFEEDLKEKLPIGLIVATIMLPIVMVDPENAPKTDGADSTLQSFSVKSSDMYAKRLSEIVDDYVKWGVI